MELITASMVLHNSQRLLGCAAIMSTIVFWDRVTLYRNSFVLFDNFSTQKIKIFNLHATEEDTITLTFKLCREKHSPLNHLAWKFGTLNLLDENGRKIHGGRPDLVMEGIQNLKVNSRSLPQGEPDTNILVGSLSWEPPYCALKKCTAVTYRGYKDTYWRTPLRFLTQLVLVCVEITRSNSGVNWVRMVLRWMNSYSTNPKHSQNARFSHTFWLNWGA